MRDWSVALPFSRIDRTVAYQDCRVIFGHFLEISSKGTLLRSEISSIPFSLTETFDKFVFLTISAGTIFIFNLQNMSMDAKPLNPVQSHPLRAGRNFTVTPTRLCRCFLADRTNGHAYGTILCPSVCRPSVCSVCIVAKRYVLY